jgi:cellulose synthase/poly-beta-1,6-N-acetylglucosamine synthase-like glycosyltransferase
MPTKGKIKKVYSNGNGDFEILLVSKENAGKGYALNTGFQFVKWGFTCIFDADTIADPEGIMGLVYPMMKDNRLMITSGRNQIVNGCKVEDGEVTKIGLTENPLVLFQIREFLVDLISKAFGNSLNAQTVLIGNFSCYRTEMVHRINGFCERGLTEDYDYNFDVHCLRMNGEKIRIKAILTARGWTQGPHTLSGLFSQRLRWSTGILDSLIRHRKALFHERMGNMGKIMVPVQWFKAIVFPIYFVANFTLVPLGVYLWMTSPSGHLVADAFLYFYLPAYIMRFVLEVFVHNYVDLKLLGNYKRPRTYILITIHKMLFGWVYNSILLIANAFAYWRVLTGNQNWGKAERTKID